MSDNQNGTGEEVIKLVVPAGYDVTEMRVTLKLNKDKPRNQRRPLNIRRREVPPNLDTDYFQQ